MRKSLYLKRSSVNKSKVSNSFNWLDTGILIGMVTVLGYVVSYSYQKGFFLYFGVDEIFISEIPLSNIIISISAVSFVLIVLVGIYYNLESILKEISVRSNPVWLMFRSAILPLFIVTTIWFVFIEEWQLYLICISMIIFYYFVYPIFLNSGVKGYRNKIEIRLKEWDKTGVNKNNISLNLKYNPSFKIVLLILITLTSYAVSIIIGYSHAKNKDEFLIYSLSENEYFVVIANVGDKFITSPINLTENQISNKYQVIDQKSSLESPLIFEKVKIDGGVKVK